MADPQNPTGSRRPPSQVEFDAAAQAQADRFRVGERVARANNEMQVALKPSGLFGSHWHATDAMGFVAAGVAVAVAIWWSRK